MWFAMLLLAAGAPQNAWLDRLSEEAEVFKRQMPKAVSEETLVQRALKPPARFRPRVGSAAMEARRPQVVTREIVSEYGLGTLEAAPGRLHEFREVIAVDGRRISSAEKARHSLVLGVQSREDQARQRMLEEFRKFGLQNAAVEFAPAILMFTKRQIADYRFQAAGTEVVGAEVCDVLAYVQVAGAEGMLVVEGRQAVREPLAGRVYLRRPDHLPVRVTFVAQRAEGGHQFRDEAVVDYTYHPRGFLTPVSAVHRETSDGVLTVESTFRYAPFRLFGAEAEIKFTVPER